MEKYLGPPPKYNSLCAPPPTYLQVQMGKMDQWNQHSSHYKPKNLQVPKSQTAKSPKSTAATTPSNVIDNKRMWNNMYISTYGRGFYMAIANL